MILPIILLPQDTRASTITSVGHEGFDQGRPVSQPDPSFRRAKFETSFEVANTVLIGSS